MTFWVGFDVGKTFHWVSVLDDAGEVVLSRRVEATEQGLEAACSQIAGLSEERKVALDVLGGPATLLLALLAERGEQIFHLPGLAVNRARDPENLPQRRGISRDACPSWPPAGSYPRPDPADHQAQGPVVGDLPGAGGDAEPQPRGCAADRDEGGYARL